VIEPAKEIDLDCLHLDVRNPRFGLLKAQDEGEALAILIDAANIKELWASIAARGFERFEPLIAIADEETPGHYIVIEGNRRLAACKTLSDPDSLGARRIKLPVLREEVRRQISTLPVVVVANREEAEAYIGFKHVNGPQTWDSLAKARFGVHMLENVDDHRPLRERMLELTQKLGDSRGMLLRVFVAFKIYEQAILEGIVESISINNQKLEFSHLYTMLNNPPSREFIGLPITALSEESVVDNPVPMTHLDNLRDLFGWLFGPTSVIKRQGSDRPRLQKVMASREGIEALRSSNDLDYAFATAGLARDDWTEQTHRCAAIAKNIDADALEVLEGMDEEEVSQTRATLARAKLYLDSVLAKMGPGSG